MPRSGSSMVAGLFHRHGVWAGISNPGDQKNPTGYFENTLIKAAARRWTGGINWDAKVFDFEPGWYDVVQELLDAQKYPGGRWLYKFSALKWKLWGEFEPYWVKVRRDHDSVFKSCRKCSFPDPRLTEKQLHERIDLHNRVMDEIPGVDVYTPDVVGGDYRTLKAAMDQCGIEMDPWVVAEFIMPDAWHYR